MSTNQARKQTRRATYQRGNSTAATANLGMFTKMFCQKSIVTTAKFVWVWLNYANNPDFGQVFSRCFFFAVWTISFICFFLHLSLNSIRDSLFHCWKSNLSNPTHPNNNTHPHWICSLCCTSQCINNGTKKVFFHMVKM